MADNSKKWQTGAVLTYGSLAIAGPSFQVRSRPTKGILILFENACFTFALWEENSPKVAPFSKPVWFKKKLDRTFRPCHSKAIMKWLKEKGDFLTLAGLMVALAGLMVALTSLIIASIQDFKADMQQNIVVLRTDTQKSIETLRTDTQKSIETLRTDTQKSIEALRTDTQKSIEILQADVREIRTLLVTHVVDHHNQSLTVSTQKTPRNRKKPRDVSSAP